MSEIHVVGLDLAKQIFQVHAITSEGAVSVKRQLRRSQLLTFFSKVPSCLVGMEACGGAHFWAREIAKLGHQVRLMPPSYAKPYVKRGKTWPTPIRWPRFEVSASSVAGRWQGERTALIRSGPLARLA